MVDHSDTYLVIVPDPGQHFFCLVTAVSPIGVVLSASKSPDMFMHSCNALSAV